MKNKLAKEFIHKVGKLGKRWGLGEPAGKIWGALAYSRKPLTQKEIAGICNYSLGLVSRNLRTLKKLNIATISSRRGKKRLYKTVTTFSESFSKLISKFRRKDLSRLLNLLSKRFASSRKGLDKQKISYALRSLSEN